MQRRTIMISCLVLSGLAALVYQIIWTRLLGFVFGTTTEAIGTVLAVFFGGMALGNLIAARQIKKLQRPLHVYAWLELGIGVFAMASLPLLRSLPDLYSWVGSSQSPLVGTLLRVFASSLVLLPPTMAMGATLPVVARGLVDEDATVGRWSGILYAANTGGAVLGVYLCGFWGIPSLGLTRMVLVAGVVNLLVSGAAFAAAGNRLVPASPSSQPAEIRNATGTRNPERGPTALLVFFGVSGFVAIGYEIVWAKVFGIVMEGTLYGFATVLSANLCGIALGSAAVAPFVDRIRDLPRAFGVLHLAIPVSVVLGMLAVPDLPFVLEQLAGSTGAGDAVHLLFVIVAPIVLVPTALFGAAFPILIRLFSRRAETAGHSVGIATAVNTAGSIAASVLVGLWSIPRIGTNATLYALLLLELGVALMVLLRFQTSRGRERVAVTGLAGALGIVLALSFNGVNVAEALSGRQVRATSLAEYREILDTKSASLIYLAEGKNAVVSVEETPQLRRVSTNGLSEAALAFAPPYYSKETILLAALPYLIADSPERSLVVGLGGGNTVAGLVATGVHSIDVVELEGKIVEAVTLLFEGRANPLADPRVTVRINDGRNELLRGRHLPEARFDIITSQPSHPWRAGAASLFTEEFFQLARANLSPGGVFASWIDGFRLDAESLLAVMASFDRAFPGGMVVNGSSGDSRKSFILLGALEPLSVSTDRMAARMAEPALRELLALFEMRSVEEVLARFDAPVASFAAFSPELANTDDNAFVETRIPRKLRWRNLDWLALESRLDANTPLLPPLRGGVDLEAIVQAVLQSEDDTRWSDGQKLERLLRVHGGEISPVAKAIWLAEASLRHPRSEQQALDRLAALGEHHPGNPEPLRVVGRHLVSRRGEGRDAARWFAAAWERSRDPSDAYAAGAAIADLDPDRAERWFARIPEPERARFPGLALHIARRSLAQGLSGKMLRPAYQALLQYRQTPEGWSVKGIDELLARIAAAVGERRGAIRHAERARRARAQEAQSNLEDAHRALQLGDYQQAWAALQQAAEGLPGDRAVEELRARVAIARGDEGAARRALTALRNSAPSVSEGIAAENRLRIELGMRPLPLRSAAALLGAQD